MATVTISPIAATECIGNSLFKINTNFNLLQDGGNDTYTRLLQLSADMTSQLNTIRATTVPISAYNTLVRTLTSFAGSGTTYPTLSTSFRSLSARII